MNAHTGWLKDGDTRSLPRAHLFLSATIHFDRESAPIRLRDLSASGARIQGGNLPDAGARVNISRGELDASGSIVWRDEKGGGVAFDEPLPLDEWMPALAPRQDVLPVSNGQPANALGQVLPQRLAEELAYVSRLLESLGEDLCAEPLVVMRHAVKLQNLDESAQILGHIAALLVAEQPEQAIDAIGMVSLRKRLRRRTL